MSLRNWFALFATTAFVGCANGKQAGPTETVSQKTSRTTIDACTDLVHCLDRTTCNEEVEVAKCQQARAIDLCEKMVHCLTEDCDDATETAKCIERAKEKYPVPTVQ